MSKILFGCDPEFFLRDKKTGSFVSAFGKFPGDKKDPYKLDGGAVQVDGLALEFNIDATDDPAVFHDRVNHVLEQIYDMMGQVDKNLEAVFTPYTTFEPQYFKDLPDECKILGCDPDFDANGNPNEPPTHLMHRPERTAAGHVHIGWTSGANIDEAGHRLDCSFIAKHFGQYDNDFSQENARRQQYYGRSGAHRPKSYGVELRSGSNGWVIGKKSKSSRNNPFGLISHIKRQMESLG